jgi:hypothetical protein
MVDDGLENSESAMVNIEVTPVNDAPLADPQAVTTWQSVPVLITLSGEDVDGDSLTYRVVDAPQYGTHSGAGADLVYTPNAGFSGEDSYTFVASDGELDSNVAMVIIRINPVVYVPIIFR